MQKTTHYDRRRLPVLVTRLRAAEGGEVVKFSADAMTAIFPATAEPAGHAARRQAFWADVPAHRALLAARAAQEGKYYIW